MIPARYRAAHNQALRRYMETGKGSLLGRRVELEAVHRDGHEFPIEFTISAVKIGGTFAFNAFLHDISERKQADEIVRRLADVVQASHDAIVATGPQGEITAWNAGAAELYGYQEEEMLGRELDLLMPADRADSDRRLLGQALAGRRLEDYETDHVRKDGSLVPVSLTVSPMRDARRAIAGASVIVRDRTERQRAEEAMREVQEAFRRAFEDAPIGMALFGVTAAERARLLQVNHSLSEITGYAPRELEAMTTEQVTHPDDLDTEQPLLEQLLSGEIPNYQLEKRFLRGDGKTVWVMYNASTVHDSAGRLLYGIAQVQDITRRKNTEDRLASVAAELERRATELERSNSDLQEFAYVASHDLSEPLRMVSSYVQLLARRYGGQLDSDADEFIEFAVDGVNRMQRLIDDLLAYSRAGTQEYRIGPVDCEALVRDTLAGMQTTVTESGASVIVSDLPTVRGDEGQLRQLFQNLIGNGIKFRDDRATARRGQRRARRDRLRHGNSAWPTTGSASTRATPTASSPSSSGSTRARSTRGAASGCRSASGSWSATRGASGSSRASSGAAASASRSPTARHGRRRASRHIFDGRAASRSRQLTERHGNAAPRAGGDKDSGIQSATGGQHAGLVRRERGCAACAALRP